MRIATFRRSRFNATCDEVGRTHMPRSRQRVGPQTEPRADRHVSSGSTPPRRFDDLDRVIEFQRLAPVQEFDRVHPALAAQGLVDCRARTIKPLGKGPHRQAKPLGSIAEDPNQGLVGLLLQRGLGWKAFRFFSRSGWHTQGNTVDYDVPKSGTVSALWPGPTRTGNTEKQHHA